jgi:hypothetical protein
MTRRRRTDNTMTRGGRIDNTMTRRRIDNTMTRSRIDNTMNPSRAYEFTPVFNGVRVARSLVFYVVFCRSLFVLFLLAIVL